MAPRITNPSTRVDNRASRSRYLTTTNTPAPPLPSYLPSQAAALWSEVWSAGGGAYALTDSRAIARYVELQLQRRAHLAVLDAEGWVTFGSRGQCAAHPVARMLDATDGKLQQMEDRLGLNPEARIRLGIASVEGESKLSAFLNS